MALSRYNQTISPISDPYDPFSPVVFQALDSFMPFIVWQQRQRFCWLTAMSKLPPARVLCMAGLSS